MNETPKGKRTAGHGKWTFHLAGGSVLTVEFDEHEIPAGEGDGMHFFRAGRIVATVYFAHVAAIVKHDSAK
jgi:hypothetical protein